MPILLCKKCNVYYEIDSKEDMADIKTCECGNSLVYWMIDHQQIMDSDHLTKELQKGL